ncbi:helix-turn-helix domain-containing protein [Arthrobacter sp. G119Y2]|uniref:helix-turn-helix domain-containing protein n=1 Tax=Arthrobacter sp. G119Y2 TaxID=3134965 RepID=UPI00311A2CE1
MVERLEPGFVVLMDAEHLFPLPSAPGWADALVTRFSAAGVSALLYRPGNDGEGTPEPLVQSARLACLPLFELPVSTTLREVEQYVFMRLQREELIQLQRFNRLLTSLLEAAGSPDPLNAVVARLADVVSGSAFVYDLSGKIIHSAGTGPARLIWDAHATLITERVPLQIGRWTAMTRRVARGPDIFLVAVASQQSQHLAEIAEPALEASAQLFRTISGINSAAWTNQQHYGQSLLSLLRNGISPHRERRLLDQLLPYGFRTGDSFRFAVLSAIGEPSLRRHHDLLSLGLELGLGLIVAEHYDVGASPVMHALATERSQLSEWFREAGASHVVGASEPFYTLTGSPEAYQEAETARTVAERRRPPGQGLVIRMEDVGLAAWLKARNPGPSVADRMARQTAPLRDQPQLRETLVLWFAHGMDVRSTAQAMFVHPNSIRYRLRRCEELLGSSLQYPEMLANVYLALQDEVLTAEADGALSRGGGRQGVPAGPPLPGSPV